MRRSTNPRMSADGFGQLGRRLLGLVTGAALMAATATAAHAEAGAYITFDVASGEVYARHNADQAWYPASITKLMTTYVVFQMIKQGKLTFNSPVVVSALAAHQPPSKMGFPPGTVLTIDNALKMIMVKSANDIAFAIGETVGGSREGFARLMNAYAQQIGMTSTIWNNPNGLPDPNQMTTAHDMGLLARALLREFPEYDFYYRLPGIQLGNRVIANHNHLMDHYPGADGMKTGYICSAGFNVVASATRNGHRLVTVVLGAHGARPRAELAAELFNRGFDRASGAGNLFGFASATETLDSYRPGPEAGQPVRDIKSEICGGKRNTGSDEAIDEADVGTPGNARDASRPIPPGQQAPKASQVEYLTARFDIGRPVKVWIGGADPVAGRSAALTAPVPVAAPEPQPISVPSQPTPVLKRAPGAIMPTPHVIEPAETDAAAPQTAPAASPAEAPQPPVATVTPDVEPQLRGMPVPEARPQIAVQRHVAPPKKTADIKKPAKTAKAPKVDKAKKPTPET